MTLAVHLLAVNLACAGPLLGAWLGSRDRGSSPLRDRVGQRLAWLSAYALILGMFTGGVLYLTAEPNLVAAISRLPSRALWFAGLELVFSLVLLLIYAGCWQILRRHRWWHALLAVLSSTNLLYHFPPLMAILGQLAADPHWSHTESLNRAALLPLMGRGEVLALSAHFTLASVAVSAVFVLCLLYRLMPNQPNDSTWEQTGRPLSRRAAWIALVISFLQLPVGIWLMIALPRPGLTAIMGGSAIASFAFLGSWLVMFIFLQRLLTIAIGSAERNELRSVCWLLVLLVLLMTVTLQSTRAKQNRAVSSMPSSSSMSSSSMSSKNLHSVLKPLGC